MKKRKNDETCTQFHSRECLHLSREEEGCRVVGIWHRASAVKFINLFGVSEIHILIFFSLAKDSVKGFDACNLTLQPAHIPVITKEGYLFDKEAILQYIITKKGEYSRKMKEYEKQKVSDVKELEEIAMVENKKKLDKFIRTEKNIKSKDFGEIYNFQF